MPYKCMQKCKNKPLYRNYGIVKAWQSGDCRFLRKEKLLTYQNAKKEIV